jgi:hypothetical protein
MAQGEASTQPDPVHVRAIELATVVREARLFPDEQVGDAQRKLKRGWGYIPTLEQLAEICGIELVQEVANRVLSVRVAELRERMERAGHGSPCHLCGGPRQDHDPRYDFGLAKIIAQQTEWGGTVASLALNIFTLPLGFAVGATPGQSTQAQISRCTLVMCGGCAQRKSSFFGGLKLTRDDCSRHPSWNRLVHSGFDRFLSAEELAGAR